MCLLNLEALNNLKQVDMSLKSFNQSLTRPQKKNDNISFKNL